MLITLRGQRVNRCQKNESCITSMMLVNEMLQTVNVISSFQDYITSPRFSDFTIDNHKEQISIECRK